RLVSTAVPAVGLAEVSFRVAASVTLRREAPLVALVAWPALHSCERLRAPFAAHPVLTVVGSASFVGLVVVATRAALLFWHNQIVARITGSFLAPDDLRFPQRKVDVLAEIARRPPGTLFVGLEARRRRFGWSWRPVYISQR